MGPGVPKVEFLKISWRYHNNRSNDIKLLPATIYAICLDGNLDQGNPFLFELFPCRTDQDTLIQVQNHWLQSTSLIKDVLQCCFSLHLCSPSQQHLLPSPLFHSVGRARKHPSQAYAEDTVHTKIGLLQYLAHSISPR